MVEEGPGQSIGYAGEGAGFWEKGKHIDGVLWRRSQFAR